MTQALTDVSGVGPSMAEILKKHDVTSVRKLADIELHKLTEIPGIGQVTGQSMIESAGKLLDAGGQKAENATSADESQAAPAEKPAKKAKKAKKEKKQKKEKKKKSKKGNKDKKGRKRKKNKK